jgi:hypothetical protein
MAKKAHLTGHETKRVVIKEGDVDVKIIPLINWLNSFESITTLFSCEGDGKKKIEKKVANQPYVLFTCWDHFELSAILRELDRCGCGVTCEATYWAPYPLRYMIKFEHKKGMLEFCKRKNIKKFS